MRSCRVRVPASSANLGPGFDILAVAVGLYLEVEAHAASGEPRVVVGPDLHGGGDLVVEGVRRVAAAAGRPVPGCRLHVRSDIPIARGLGSSAAALIAGLLVGNHLLGDPLDRAGVYRLACEAEGHGDNVAAALFGGVALAVPTADGIHYQPLTLGRPLRAVVFVPEQTAFTCEARAVVPDTVARVDAVANAARCALLVLALTGGRLELLAEAMDDRLHQPYRTRIFPYLPTLIAAARAAGAAGACLSGAGPSVLALAEPDRAAAVRVGLADAAAAIGIAGETLDLPIEPRGAEVVPAAGEPASEALAPDR
ncbi:MAG: homoserine kinase [Sphaerobacter sp.]|nr:homoserine kinase [Sphaerobacter sp.]